MSRFRGDRAILRLGAFILGAVLALAASKLNTRSS